MMPAPRAKTRTTDALDRRSRFARPQPKVRHLAPTEADYLIFEAIDRHGPLPTGYLYEFSRHLRRNFAHLQNRLTELYNGDVASGSAGTWLTRPPQQFANFETRYQHMVYGLSPRASAALAERGTLSRFGERRGPFVHQLMAACVGASIELTATRRGIRYIPRDEIFAHPKCAAARQSPAPLAIPLSGQNQRQLIPDDLFGLRYPDGGYRFFALETDRATESIVGGKGSRNSYAGKIAGYAQVLQAATYRQWWGVPNLTVLTVTTNQRHAGNLIAQARQAGDVAPRFAFAVEKSFGTNWRVPKEVLDHLLTSPWTGVSGGRLLDRA